MPALPEGIDPKYLKRSYQTGGGPLSRRDLLFGRLSPRYEVVPAVETATCMASKGCAQCVGACPQQAIAVDGSTAVIDKAKCIGCGACLSNCPVGAVRQPLLNPERLEVELGTLLQPPEVTPEPRILLVEADGGPPLERPDGLCSLRLPSVGAVSAWLLLRAFTLGADGIAVLACRSGCRHRCDQTRWEHTLRFTREVLALFGVEAGRLVVIGREEAERPPWLQVLGEVLAALGPHRLRGAAALGSSGTPSLAEILRNSAALVDAPSGFLKGDVVPFGMMRVEASRCTLCGACQDCCPTGALKLDEDGDTSRLVFDHARCSACEACVKVCPERAVEVQRHLELVQLERQTLLAEDELARCQRCGISIAPQRMLRKIEHALGRKTVPGRYCPSCQMYWSLAAGRQKAAR